MKTLSLILLLPSVLAEQLIIPQIQEAIKAQNLLFSKYVTYSGPVGAAQVEAQQTLARFNNLAVTPQAASPYWYESIAHQGVAAFNTQSGYKVFRNAKAYGAKGSVESRRSIRFG